jgi:hypothetical protein
MDIGEHHIITEDQREKHIQHEIKHKEMEIMSERLESPSWIWETGYGHRGSSGRSKTCRRELILWQMQRTGQVGVL